METSVLNYTNYKDFLKFLLHSDSAPRGLQSQMAKHLNCQSSYIYQVLKGKGELTEDQAFLTTTFLNFSELETEYFLLLVRHSKAINKEMKKYIELELKKIKTKAEDLSTHSDATKPDKNEEAWRFYFSKPKFSFIHLLTGSTKYQTIETLSEKLNIDPKELLSDLKDLQKYGFVAFEDNRWVNKSPSIHFSNDSAHNLNLHLLRRSQALNAIIHSDRKEHLHFSNLFALDPKSYDLIRKQLSESIHKLQKKIHAGGSDELYVMCVDLFSPVL